MSACVIRQNQENGLSPNGGPNKDAYFVFTDHAHQCIVAHRAYHSYIRTATVWVPRSRETVLKTP